jgi:hypothetical protein
MERREALELMSDLRELEKQLKPLERGYESTRAQLKAYMQEHETELDKDYLGRPMLYDGEHDDGYVLVTTEETVYDIRSAAEHAPHAVLAASLEGLLTGNHGAISKAAPATWLDDLKRYAYRQVKAIRMEKSK